MTGTRNEVEKQLADLLFQHLSRRYVQRQDDRQRQMGLQYTTAETHDLADTIARFVMQHPPLDVTTQVINNLEAVQTQAAGVRSALGLTGLESRPLSAYVRDVIRQRDAAQEELRRLKGAA